MLHRRQRKKSKGMRKHIRRQKALKRKNELKEQKNKQAASQLPDYDSFPRRHKGPFSWECPHCRNSQYRAYPIRITIQTKQGPRELIECEYYDCKKLFRL